MLSRAEEELAAGRAAYTQEQTHSEAEVARLAAATKRAEELDARLLAELEVQRKLKQALHQAEMLLERESQRLVLVETELITKQVRHCQCTAVLLSDSDSVLAGANGTETRSCGRAVTLCHDVLRVSWAYTRGTPLRASTHQPDWTSALS